MPFDFSDHFYPTALSASLNADSADTTVEVDTLSSAFASEVQNASDPAFPLRLGRGPSQERVLVTGIVDEAAGQIEVERDAGPYGLQAHNVGTRVAHAVPAGAMLEREAVQSQIVKPRSPGAFAYDDFDRSTRSLDGDSMPSGQTWTADGFAEIDGRRAYGNTSPLVVSTSQIAGTYQESFVQAAGGGGAPGGLILAYKDSSNFLYATTWNSRLAIQKVVGDITTRVATTGALPLTNWRNIPYPLRAAVSFDSDYNMVFEWIGERLTFAGGSDADVVDLIENGSGVGLWLGASDFNVERYFAYQI